MRGLRRLAPVHRRGDRVHGACEVVGLAGEEDHVVLGPQLLGEHCAHVELRVAGRAFDHEPVARELLAPLRAHEERDVGARFREAPAEVAADAAGAEDEDAHERGYMPPIGAGAGAEPKSNAPVRSLAAASRVPSGARFQRFSMKRRIEVVSYSVWST